MLYIFSGLPGVGKSHLAKFLAERISATYIRIDTIEQSLKNAGLTAIGPIGYLVAYDLAADNLRLGKNVVADSVNPISKTRNAWEEVATTSSADFINIQIICSNESEHRTRVETRISEIRGHVQPTWNEVLDKKREYESWSGNIITIDTAGQEREQSENALVAALEKFR